MKAEVINKLNKVFDYVRQANPELATECITEDVMAYLQVIEEVKQSDKAVITDIGKVVLKYMQNNTKPSKAKTIAEADGVGLAPKTVSGALRKLVIDGYVEKIVGNPCVYAITSKGKEFEID